MRGGNKKRKEAILSPTCGGGSGRGPSGLKLGRPSKRRQHLLKGRGFQVKAGLAGREAHAGEKGGNLLENTGQRENGKKNK